MTVEAFGLPLPELAAATRDLAVAAPQPVRCADGGYRLMRKGMDAA
ncbi:MAG: hypothetical protein ABIO40_10310 [Devosia sp.]